MANGLAPDMLPDLGRYEAIQNDMFTRLNGGTLPRTQARIQALSPEFSRRECVAAKSLNIQVNPQFGQLDYGTYSVIPASSPLSAADRARAFADAQAAAHAHLLTIGG